MDVYYRRVDANEQRFQSHLAGGKQDLFEDHDEHSFFQVLRIDELPEPLCISQIRSEGLHYHQRTEGSF